MLTPYTHAPRALGLGLALALISLATPQAHADFVTTRVASGLSNPMYATHAPGRPNEMFIIERAGAIKLLDKTTGQISPTHFLNITDTDVFFEGGLLGLAFHPDFASNGKFYVNVTTDENDNNNLTTRIREYTVTNPLTDTTANPTPNEVLSFAQPGGNHNGGWIGFSPTDNGSYLYIMSGDGGGSNDNGAGHTAGIGNAQDITDNLLGKVLRIDVDGDDFAGDTTRDYAIPASNPFVGVTGDDEIWAYGLRNPFRASFDRQTGDLYIGDVGQGAREEINRQPGTSAGGENYGWRLREGDIATPGVGGPEPADHVGPIYDYISDSSGPFTGNSVTGGQLYRGPVAELQGQYIFADFIDQHIWSFDPANPDATVARVNDDFDPTRGNINSIAAITEDAAGNLYFIDFGGEIFRVNLPGDINGDGFVGIDDLSVILANWNQNVTLGNYARGDIAGNGDAFVGIDDLNVILANWNTGTPPPTTTANIPEPGTLMLCVLTALPLTRRL